MPSANIIELESCIDDCIAYCDENPQSEFSTLYREKLLRARHRWEKAVRLSDEQHTKWRSEQREERLAWKHLATTLRESQKQLRSVGAKDFPDLRILYWDVEALMVHVERMQVYLRENGSDYDFTQELLDRFTREIDAATSEEREAGTALKDYQRFVDIRREAMTELGSMIGDFRIALRRGLGKRHPAYQKIHWPHAIASDEGVLF